MAEAAMLTACMLGKRFAIVTFAQALGPWYEECVETHGLSGRWPASACSTAASAPSPTCRTRRKSCWCNSPTRAVTQDEADVVILAGAPLAGLAEKVKHRIPVPVVDQMAAAVKQAEALVSLRVRKATAGTFRRPAAKPTIGLSPALAERFGRN